MSKWKEIPIVSAALVAANIFVFLICTFTGNLLYNMGRLEAYLVLVVGEYPRIIWSMFLHGSISHIFNNMVILFFLGAMIEKEVGHIRYTMLYFLSGIGGNLLSLFWKVRTGDPSGSIGASGAVFGLDGVMLSMVLFYDRKLENATPLRVMLMIVYSLYSGFTGQNIDNAAHVGGLLTGFAAGTAVCLAHRWRLGRSYEER